MRFGEGCYFIQLGQKACLRRKTKPRNLKEEGGPGGFWGTGLRQDLIWQDCGTTMK